MTRIHTNAGQIAVSTIEEASEQAEDTEKLTKLMSRHEVMNHAFERAKETLKTQASYAKYALNSEQQFLSALLGNDAKVSVSKDGSVLIAKFRDMGYNRGQAERKQDLLHALGIQSSINYVYSTSLFGALSLDSPTYALHIEKSAISELQGRFHRFLDSHDQEGLEKAVDTFAEERRELNSKEWEAKIKCLTDDIQEAARSNADKWKDLVIKQGSPVSTDISLS